MCPFLCRLAFRYVESLIVVLHPWVLLTEQKAVPMEGFEFEFEEDEDARLSGREV